MTVGKFCSREVIVAEKENTIAEVARLMRDHHVGDVVITAAGENGAKPVGILTDRELYDYLEDPGEFHNLARSAEHRDTLQRMRAKGIRRVPVVNSAGGLVGILAADDLLELFAEELNLLARIPFREQLIEAVARP